MAQAAARLAPKPSAYDEASKRAVTLNKGGDTVRIGNVRAGVANSEAGVAGAVNTSNAYTDQRVCYAALDCRRH